MSKSVVITGAMGFIGSHTAKVFKEAGYHVIGVDRAQTIPQAAVYLDQLIADDFPMVAASAAVMHNSQAIVHCAGTSLVGPSIANPSEYYDNNSAKTNMMMHKLRHYGWHGTVVFSSSAATYGIPESGEALYEHSAQNPISPYGFSKLFCEQIIRDSCAAFNMKGIALRYFNACGCDPNGVLGHIADDSHMIPRVLSAYDNNRAFALYGNDYATPDGTCIRDYLHVMDIAHAHLEAVNLAGSMNSNEFRAYNLGTGQGHSNREIIAACEHAVNDQIGVVVAPRRIGDPDQLVANSDLYQKDTKWRPVHSTISNIVQTTWAWQQKLPKQLG
jgi:UDP-glucose-4-epimerase GalE